MRETAEKPNHEEERQAPEAIGLFLRPARLADGFGRKSYPTPWWLSTTSDSPLIGIARCRRPRSIFGSPASHEREFGTYSLVVINWRSVYHKSGRLSTA
jgi:hypothetical protein